MRIKTFLKRITGIAFVLAITVSSASAEEIYVFSDGYASVKDSSPFLKSGDMLNVTVAKDGADFLNPESIGELNKEDIVYFGTAAVESGGKYIIEFLPNESGKYRVYVGSDVFDKTMEYEVRYINKTKFISAAELLLGCDSDDEFARILNDKRIDLGLTDKLFDGADIATIAPVMRRSVSGVGITEYRKIITSGEKSAVAARLNAKEISDINEYSELFGLGDNEYYAKDLSPSVTEYASGKDISSCDELDGYIRDGIVLSNINKRNSNTVSAVLSRYAKELGIDSGKITTSLCRDLSGKSFENIEALVSYINNFKPTDNGGSSGSGSGGSSGGGLKNPLSGTTVTKPSDENNKYELENPFTDLDGFEWAAESIKSLYYKSVINGKETGKFHPSDMITREEFAKIITSAMKMNLIDKDIPFTDVESGSWYESYVRTAYIAGIAKGITDTEFGTGRNITREDLCVMVYRAVEAADYSLNEKVGEDMNFSDSADISDYAVRAVKTLYKSGIVNGSDGFFKPKDTASRAEAAKIINMVINDIGI